MVELDAEQVMHFVFIYECRPIYTCYTFYFISLGNNQSQIYQLIILVKRIDYLKGVVYDCGASLAKSIAFSLKILYLVLLMLIL